MRILYIIVFLSYFITPNYGQQVDLDFSRKGLLVIKELNMGASHIFDFELSDQGKFHVLYQSDGKKYITRFHKDGSEDVQFTITNATLNNQNTVPVAIHSKSDGSVEVLSNFWDGYRWMIAIHEFYEDGNINLNFGKRGIYKKRIWQGTNDTYGQYMYISPQDEILIVAKDGLNTSEKSKKLGVLKVSEQGETISSKVFDDYFFSLNCSAMNDNYLLLAYSESIDNGLERATYLAGMDSDKMTSNSLHCQIIEENYQSFDNVVLSKEKVYASQIRSDIKGLYYIYKYDVKGDLDPSFVDTGEMSYSADVYNTDFVINQKGEVYVISTSLDDDYEIIIKKLLPTGKVDPDFGENGITSIFLRYPIQDLQKMQLNAKEELYISGAMRIDGSSYGFITKVKLNLLRVQKKVRIEEFIENLFVKD